MKIPKLKKNQLILIKFLDIEEDPSWMPEAKAMEKPDCEGIGVGMYLHHDKDWLYVSTQLVGTKKPQRNKTSYPLGCVMKIKKLYWKK